jgi:hypothetical protein
MQLLPIYSLFVFKLDLWQFFYLLFLDEPQRQADGRFFNVLNKIRFGNIDEEVKEALVERFAAYNLSTELWNMTFLALLRKEARLLNQIVLDSIPINSDSFVSLADDF